MSKSKSFMSLWNFMELSEKQRLMRTFLSQHGDHFSKSDFIKFLAMRYDGVQHGFIPAHEKLRIRQYNTVKTSKQ